MSILLNNSVQQLLDRLSTCNRVFARLEGRQQALQESLDKLLQEQEACERWDLGFNKLQKIFQSIGSTEQELLQRWFEQVVTTGLVAVFGSDYRFVIQSPEIRSGEIAVDFKVLQKVGSVELELDPYLSMGGGIVDVLAFLLQFVMIFLLRERLEPILFLDESCKHLSVNHRPAMAALLQELVAKTGIQILLVTHDDVFVEAADVAYEFTHDGDETKLERLK